MTPGIDPLPPFRHPAAGWAGSPSPAPSAPGFAAVLTRTDTVQLSVPASPPEAVRDEVAAADRELHFSKDEASGRVVVQVRDMDGRVIRAIPPSDAFAVLAGGSL